MRCGYAVLIASLLLTMGGCRELGSYLSPEERADCESGARTEGCPDTLSPGAEVIFLDPHPLEAGKVYEEGGLGRYLELRFSVVSRLEIERVDLACAGLQLASWRPRERGTELDLEATVDLLPCRLVSTSDGGVDVELHTVPIEVQVLGPVGGMVVLSDWQVMVNLDDTRIPDSRALIEVALETAVETMPLGGRPLEFRAVAADPADPLAADLDPEVWVDGVRVSDAEVSQEPVGTYFIRLPSGLRTRHTTGGELSELLAPKIARVTITGTTQSGRNSVGRVEVQVEKDRSDLTNQPLLRGLIYDAGRALPVQGPVAVPAGEDPVSPGTLVVSDYSDDFRAYLFNAQDTWVPMTSHGNDVFALTEEGKILWYTEPSGPGILQTDLSPGAPPGLTVTLPELAAPGDAFRLGNGAVCVEELEPPPTVGCDVGPAFWHVQCVMPDGALDTFDFTALSDVNRGESMHTVALQNGWLSAPYQTPDCTPSQVVGAWGDEMLEVSFLGAQMEGSLRTGDTPVLLSAGPARAVVGTQNADFAATLELIDVAGGGVSLGQYFTPPASQVLSPDDAILWADAEGGLVILRAPGVLERWLPGEPTPAQHFDLATWAGATVRAPSPSYSFGGERLLELSRVVHGNGDVSFGLWRALSPDERELLTLEINRDLVPVWAHLSVAYGDVPLEAAIVTMGLPDGPYLDVMVSEPSGDLSRFFRWAR